MSDAPEFTVVVETALADVGAWVIDARVIYRDGVVPVVGSALLGEARVALLEQIIVAAARGRALGATAVRLRMDTGDHQTDIALGTAIEHSIH